MLTRNRSRSKSVDTLISDEGVESDLSQGGFSRQSSLTSSIVDSQDSALTFNYSKQTKATPTVVAKTTQLVMILPNSVLMPVSNEKQATDSTPQFISYPDPRTGSLRQYLLSADQKSLYEINKQSNKYRSWFIGNSVQSDGSLYVCTPMDPLFLALAIVVPVNNSKSRKSEKFTTLDCLLSSESCPQSAILEELISPDQWDNITDRKELHTGDSVYRYNNDKTLKWLTKKVELLAETLENEGIYVGSGSQSTGYVRSTKHISVTHDDYLYYACGMVQDYLPSSLSEQLSSKYPSSVTTKHTIELDQESNPPPSKKFAIAEPVEDYTKSVSVPQQPVLTKSLSKSASAAQKALAKVNKKGMKSMTSFFGKK